MKLRIALISTDPAEIDRLRRLLDTSDYEVTEQPIADSGAMVLEPSADVHIICQPPGFEVLDVQDRPTWRQPARPVLYTAYDASAQMRQWVFRHGGRDLLVHPFSAVYLRFAIQRLAGDHPARKVEQLKEERLLTFLDQIIQKGVRTIEPSLEPMAPQKHFYPLVADFMGRSENDFELLERLASEGILERVLVNRVRLCPHCGEAAQNYRETCPKCGSLDIIQTETIHHFACGYVGPLAAFRQGAALVCPKCTKTLRHIGLDYEKPAQHYSCSGCQYVFSAPSIDAQCLHCAFVCRPDETVPLPVYRYRLTPLARQSVAEGRIGGMNLSFLLQNVHTGLYTRQFFEHEISREFYRSQRSGNPFCLMMIRVVGFDHVRTEHPRQAREYITSIFKAISGDLRILDITCVWEFDQLAALLPATGQEGGLVVARRMHANVRALEYLYAIHEPEVEVSLVAWHKDFASKDDMIQAAIDDLQSGPLQPGDKKIED